MRCWRLACVLSVTLAGCATAPQLPQLDSAQQREVLLQLDNFSLAGRAATATGIVSVTWQQISDTANVKLSAPLGVPSMRVEFSPAQLRLETSGGIRLVDGEAEDFLVRELGFAPPFDALRYWIRGVPAPGAAAAIETRDDAGLLQQMEQQGWLIRYQRYSLEDSFAGRVRMPAKLVATRDNLQLTLVIQRWQLR